MEDILHQEKKHLPIRVKKSRATTEGPISGKMSENAEANIMASTHAAVPKVGS